jgi:death on curing protein
VTVYLNVDQLLAIAEMLGEPAVRDLGLLDAAVHRPQASAFGEDAYPDLHTKAAALLESLVRNRGLMDGNKRLGWVGTVVFYRLNGYRVAAPEDGAFDLVMGVAEGRYELNHIGHRLAGWARGRPESQRSG